MSCLSSSSASYACSSSPSIEEKSCQKDEEQKAGLPTFLAEKILQYAYVLFTKVGSETEKIQGVIYGLIGPQYTGETLGLFDGHLYILFKPDELADAMFDRNEVPIQDQQGKIIIFKLSQSFSVALQQQNKTRWELAISVRHYKIGREALTSHIDEEKLLKSVGLSVNNQVIQQWKARVDDFEMQSRQSYESRLRLKKQKIEKRVRRTFSSINPLPSSTSAVATPSNRATSPVAALNNKEREKIALGEPKSITAGQMGLVPFEFDRPPLADLDFLSGICFSI